MDKAFLAHIADINGERKEQTVKEHLLNTAQYAGENLKSCGLYNCGYLAGLIHDMGKFKLEFSKYLEDSYTGKNTKKGSVNHTFAGVIYILEKYHNDKNDAFDKLTSEIIAFAVGSHHGEFDIIDIDGQNGFEYRLKKEKSEICYEESKRNYFSAIKEDELERCFLCAKEEIKAFTSKIRTVPGIKESSKDFIFGMTARMVLSALIDGDRRDTSEFMNDKKIEEQDTTNSFWEEQLDYFENRLKAFISDTPINKARKYFSDKCAEFAKRENGIYRITIPTGAGKTLCMLRYSLAHAKEHGKKRIIFIIPLLSVLDQNSKAIRDYLKDKNIVREFHSNVVHTKDTDEHLNEFELLSEAWDSPIIISTLVQLLNVLFTNKTTAIRRMSSLCNSVIVIDEVQSLPKNMIDLFNTAINYLAYFCNTTVILSSATQPCFDKVRMSLQFSENPDIIPFDKDIFSVFKRTEVIDKTTPYGMSSEELADFAMDIMDSHYSLLVICNTKSSALNLYEYLKQLNNSRKYKLFHLSTSMCMQHREDTLKEIRAILNEINDSLKNGQKPKQKIICVSTQLVEAGVDFSFENVIRVIAGMDNITQAAGRCNRNNDFNKICNVYIVNLKNNDENLKMLQEIKVAQDCSVNLLHDFSRSPESYDNDLLCSKSIDTYYSLLFENPDIKNKFSYPVKLYGGITNNLFEMLSHNTDLCQRADGKDKYFLKQAFKTANEEFKVFDENTTDVIVPYNEEAENIINDLCSAKAKFDYSFMKKRIKDAQKYTIQIYEYQKKALGNMLFSDDGGHFLALQSQNYNNETGFEIDRSNF